MLQYQLDHMEVDRRNMEMKRTENDARNSYNDFNIIMTVSGIMIANNFAVLTAVEHGPSIHSFLFDACGSLSSFCFFFAATKRPERRRRTGRLGGLVALASLHWLRCPFRPPWLPWLSWPFQPRWTSW